MVAHVARKARVWLRGQYAGDTVFPSVIVRMGIGLIIAMHAT